MKAQKEKSKPSLSPVALATIIAAGIGALGTIAAALIIALLK